VRDLVRSGVPDRVAMQIADHRKRGLRSIQHHEPRRFAEGHGAADAASRTHHG
jgi:hypothetical protein